MLSFGLELEAVPDRYQRWQLKRRYRESFERGFCPNTQRRLRRFWERLEFDLSNLS
jgi:hypothetical protein